MIRQRKTPVKNKMHVTDTSFNPVQNNAVIALVIDLDGTLVATDTLWESLLCLIHQQPLVMLLIPFWSFKGRAGFKQQIVKRVELDVSKLPFRPEIIELINSAHLEGRSVILATASHKNVAENVAKHLGIFDKVIASTGQLNVKGTEKLDAIRELLGDQPFEYVGDSSADLPIWKAADVATVVMPTPKLWNSLECVKNRKAIGQREEPIKSSAIIRTIRIHQWAKNLLLFVPLVLAHKINDGEAILFALIAFFAFSLCASATYIWNDLLDLPSDRLNNRKTNRPLAAGVLSIIEGVVISLVLLSASLITSLMLLPVEFTLMLVGYIVLTLSYSFYLKKKLMIDILILGGLYAYRILIGAVAISVVVSPWLLAFSIFFFLSLAFVKRFTELAKMSKESKDKLPGRDYSPRDLDIIRSFGTNSGYISVLVMAFYINSPAVSQMYSSPNWLWLMCPVLLYWISRIWFLAERGQMHEDPILFAVRDKISFLVGAISGISFLLASI